MPTKGNVSPSSLQGLTSFSVLSCNFFFDSLFTDSARRFPYTRCSFTYTYPTYPSCWVGICIPYYITLSIVSAVMELTPVCIFLFCIFRTTSAWTNIFINIGLRQHLIYHISLLYQYQYRCANYNCSIGLDCKSSSVICHNM